MWCCVYTVQANMYIKDDVDSSNTIVRVDTCLSLHIAMDKCAI